MDQLTLPYSGRSAATAERSRKAAEGAAPHVSRRQREVLAFLATCGDRGATDNSIIAYVVARGGSANGPRARRVELVRSGCIEDSGEERDGSTVWTLTAAGREVLNASGL